MKGYKMSKILQLKISLKGSKPRIWRKVLVDDTISFHTLHKIIQKVMGWENYHLYEFKVDNLSILEPSEDYSHKVTDSKKILLKDALTTEKQKFSYKYDFGDCWEHSIIVEKILEKDESKKYPICIEGKMACPPEDCGGVWSYKQMLNALKDKNHPEYERWTEWIGEFDAEEFDIDKVNQRL